ncbi:formyl peptide receptor-related sequence 1 isoform X2 [Carassius gibelio]|uniref:formyl peptide receptor-related sequence 1 isoform X2 n=1 Tax=Carassius gibelio TaxID=101364 RepID=UPI0022789034|nr:formyl peptide receptor-related sequence 1 isoform X2 [Carassius gibelio]
MISNPTLSPQSNSNTSMSYEKTTVDIVFYSIIVLFGTTGNSLVIWVAGFRMKPTVTNVWLVNLAVADLIFSLTRVTSLISSLFFDHWPFGVFLCKFNGFFKYANMFCSVFHLAVISVDRALCIWRPVFTRKRRTLCAARVVSVGVWIVAVMLSSPYFLYRQVFLEKNNLSHCSFKEKGEEGDGSSANCCWDTQNTALWKIKASSDSCRFGLCLFLMLGSLSRSRTGQVGE